MADTTLPEVHFLKSIIVAIVDNPNDVVIHRTIDELGVLLEVQVHADDTGKVIGKGGQTIRALRTLLRAFGSQLSGGLRVSLSLSPST